MSEVLPLRGIESVEAHVLERDCTTQTVTDQIDTGIRTGRQSVEYRLVQRSDRGIWQRVVCGIRFIGQRIGVAEENRRLAVPNVRKDVPSDG